MVTNTNDSVDGVHQQKVGNGTKAAAQIRVERGYGSASILVSPAKTT